MFEAHTPLGRPGLSADSGDPIVLDDPVIKEIAAKHSATAAQVRGHLAIHMLSSKYLSIKLLARHARGVVRSP